MSAQTDTIAGVIESAATYYGTEAHLALAHRLELARSLALGRQATDPGSLVTVRLTNKDLAMVISALCITTEVLREKTRSGT